jgi:hypothetical protein
MEYVCGNNAGICAGVVAMFFVSGEKMSYKIKMLCEEFSK